MSGFFGGTASETKGRTLRANQTLVAASARLAAQVARALNGN